MSTIASLSTGYLPSLLNSLAAKSTRPVNLAINTTSVSATISYGSQDSAQLSPLAQFIAQLQNLQESNPTEYKSFLSQIASNLKVAAVSATKSGDSYAASEYDSLVNGFTSAAKSGSLPDIQDLVQVFEDQSGVATFALPPQSPPPNNSSNVGTSTNSANKSANTNQSDKLIADILQALYSNNAQNDSSNPVNITLNTFQSSLSLKTG